MKQKMIGYDAKRIVRNATGLGSYGRTLINDLAPLMPDTELRLYAPDAGRDELRGQILPRENVSFSHPRLYCRLQRDLWRMYGVVNNLKRDGVRIYHGLSGELPCGLSKAGIPGVLTVHALIFGDIPSFIRPSTCSSTSGNSAKCCVKPRESSPSVRAHDATF